MKNIARALWSSDAFWKGLGSTGNAWTRRGTLRDSDEWTHFTNICKAELVKIGEQYVAGVLAVLVGHVVMVMVVLGVLLLPALDSACCLLFMLCACFWVTGVPWYLYRFSCPTASLCCCTAFPCARTHAATGATTRSTSWRTRSAIWALTCGRVAPCASSTRRAPTSRCLAPAPSTCSSVLRVFAVRPALPSVLYCVCLSSLAALPSLWVANCRGGFSQRLLLLAVVVALGGLVRVRDECWSRFSSLSGF